ncbi:hypothetical protein MBLNU230_g0127t1 [Neophaeotheca triangularis]
MADRRGVIVPLLFLAFFFLQPGPRAAPNHFEHIKRFEDVVNEEEQSLELLNNSTWNGGTAIQDGSLNLTGFEPERSYSWNTLPEIKDRAKDLLRYALPDTGEQLLIGQDPGPKPYPIYHNVTSLLHGEWVHSRLQDNISVPRLNLSEYTPEGPLGPRRAWHFSRNITGDGGSMTVRFNEKAASPELNGGKGVVNYTEMSVDLKLSTDDTYEEWDTRLRGVYFTQFGQAILTTTSDKFAGIFALPHLTLSEPSFDMARATLNESLSKVIEMQRSGYLDSRHPWTSNTDGTPETQFSPPRCELVVYLQQLPPQAAQPEYSTWLTFLERELRFPTGAFLPTAPPVRFSMLAFSPDCGYVLESKGEPEYAPQQGEHLVGPKIEALYQRGRHHLLLLVLALGLQLVLLMRQMSEASTPSTRSRISFYTVAGLALGDGFTTMAFCLLSMFLPGLWLNLIAAAFLAFMSVSFFGMRFLLDIWTVQAPEREAAQREEDAEEQRRQERLQAVIDRLRAQRNERLAAIRNAHSPENEASAGEQQDQDASQPQPPTDSAETEIPQAPTPRSGDEPPAPVIAQPTTDTGAAPVFIPSDQEGFEPAATDTTPTRPGTTGTAAVRTVTSRQASFGSLYTRFYLLLLGTLFISLNAAGWPAGLRRFYFTALALAYLSFWLPQINRNTQRNCRHAFNWEFVIGQSILRLLPFAYFYGYPDNVLFAKQDYVGLALLGSWVWLQILILASQELIGPRWFVKSAWVPPAYDYHPVLREDAEGATLPVGFTAATASSEPPSSPTARRASTSSGSPLARRGSLGKKEAVEKGKRVFDCAICMQELEVPVVEEDGTSGAGVLARRMYMVTPCRHIFHSSCLEGWMKYRLQCPVCREGLPPL